MLSRFLLCDFQNGLHTRARQPPLRSTRKLCTSRPVHDFELHVLIASRPSFQIPASRHSTRRDYEVVVGQGPQAQDVNPYLVASLRVRLLRRASLRNGLSKSFNAVGACTKHSETRDGCVSSPSGSAGSTCNELEEWNKS